MSRPAPLPADLRAAPRQKVFLPAEMKGGAVVEGGGASRVHLLNLSAVGTLVHGSAAPTMGAIVQLRCEAATWFGQVVWTTQKRFGVMHLTPLSEDAVVTLVSGCGG